MEVEYSTYTSESQLPGIMAMIGAELSEPYSVFTYRYFLNSWPHLCIIASVDGQEAGVIICKADEHKGTMRGYIAMLAVKQELRRKGIGRQLVKRAVDAMIADNVQEIAIETEATNVPGLNLYQSFGFARDKRLKAYYLNGNDAFRLKLWLR